MKNRNWPELSYEEARETYETIHLWTQIAGKVKLCKLPWINHSWHITLLVTPQGLTTGNIPAEGKSFQLNFDFLQHRLQIITSSREEESIGLQSLSVASCYDWVMNTLKQFGITCKINPVPNEIADAVPLNEDHEHAGYNPTHAANLHQALINIDEVMTQFRSEFIGKCSPVHFFWGSFDLAVTRFSGKEAPRHPGGIPNLPDWVAQEAYSHEVSSCGFWPGNAMVPFAAFYSYAYPEPEHFREVVVKPDAAWFEEGMGEFLLPYKVVQQAENPAQTLLGFLQSTYEAAADLAKWDRIALEK